MGRFVVWVAALAAAGFSATGTAQAACEPTKAAAKYPALAGHTITIGQDGESSPFSFRDPKDFSHLIGLDADLARATFACVGIPITFTTGSWSGLIPAAMSGQIDVMWDTLLYTPERAKKLDFVAYMNSATGMLVAAGNPKHLNSLDDLCGMVTTAGLGTTQEVMMRDAGKKCVAAGKKDVEVITAADIPAGMRLVQSGRADLAATNLFVGGEMAASNPAVTMAFNVVTNARIAAGTAKEHPQLVQAMADGLAELQASGEMRTIFDRYHVDYSLVTKPEILTQ